MSDNNRTGIMFDIVTVRLTEGERLSDNNRTGIMFDIVTVRLTRKIE